MTRLGGVRASERAGRAPARPFRSLLCAGLAVAVAAASAAGAAAQDRPDFSGHWTLQGGGAGAAGARPSPGSGWGPSFTIVQRGDTLLLERAFFSPGDLQPPLRLRYALDGGTSHNEILMGRGTQRLVSRATWDGGRLVLTTTFHDDTADGGRGVTSEVRHTLSYEPAVREAHPPLLVIETWRAGAMGGADTTVRSVYVRS